MRTTGKKKDTATAILTLLPSLTGFSIFVLFPILISLVMVFTNWDLKIHNTFNSTNISFVGLLNVKRLLTDSTFWKYLGNTLFFMLNIPINIFGSLFLAIFLTKNLKCGISYKGIIGFSLLLLIGYGFLAIAGANLNRLLYLMIFSFGFILAMGMFAGAAFYRTLFYLPYFTSGVAVFILWKNMYNPLNGPMNQILTPVLNLISGILENTSDTTYLLIKCLLVSFMILCIWKAHRLTITQWKEGDLGIRSCLILWILSTTPTILSGLFFPFAIGKITFLSTSLILSIITINNIRSVKIYRRPKYHNLSSGLGRILLPVSFAMIALLLSILIEFVSNNTNKIVPLSPPLWLTDYNWAKPALMIMGTWIAVGSNNMLLYISALQAIPKSMYEVADLDGASHWNKFIYITWPQIMPITFFVAITSFVDNLEGGFEMAQSMTDGGPAGATKTLSYYVYEEGFLLGRLSYGCTIAWSLTLMILLLTWIYSRYESRIKG